MNRKMMRFRRAETNKALMIALGVVAVLAVAFWGYRMMTEEQAPPVQPIGVPATFYCTDCKKTFEVPEAEVGGLKAVEGMYECRICKKMTASPGFGPNPRMRP